MGIEDLIEVGLLDADVYGPSIPVMMDLSQKPETEHGMIVPIEKFGLKTMSFGFFLGDNQPLIWRGPLVAKAMRQSQQYIRSEEEAIF